MHRDFRQAHLSGSQERFGTFNALPQHPPMRRLSHRMPKEAREVSARNAAFGGDSLKRDISVNLAAQYLLGSSLLPWRQPSLRRRADLAHSSVSFRDVYRQGKRDVIYEEGCRLLRLLHCCVDGAAEMSHRRVVDRQSRLQVKIRDTWGVCVIADFIQQLSGQMIEHAAQRRADERTWRLLEIVNDRLTGAKSIAT
jgi:hypothetical protein